VYGRAISAFTRVFDTLWAQAALRTAAYYPERKGFGRRLSTLKRIDCHPTPPW
jgi:hypothetical protein